MKYQASIREFFLVPKWKNNLLLGALAMLIPAVGPIVLSGWLITCLWARGNNDDPAGHPPFDFQDFVKYLMRGLWPFLVAMVASLVMVPLMMVVMVPLMLASGAVGSHHSGAAEGVAVAMIALMVILQLVMTVGIQVLVVPLSIRATLTQDFAPAFNLGFLKSFLRRVWPELLMSMLFMLGVGLAMLVLTVITCYIGGLLASPVMLYAWHHLQKQLYQLYLSRGGEAVPASPKLNDLPPPLPGR